MSKKMSKINQSRIKLKVLKKMIEDREYGKIKPRKTPKLIKGISALLLSMIALGYAITIYHFFA